jgi:Family of unknown function (DUF5677)
VGCWLLKGGDSNVSYWRQLEQLVRSAIGLLPRGVPLPDDRDSASDPPRDYLDRLTTFASEVGNCMHISRSFGGIPSPTTRHFYASVLFTSLVTRSTSLVFISPYSPWSRRDFEHWDFGSVANITRTIMETRLAFYYLCIDPCDEQEWQCRWNIFNLHDCVSRVTLMRDMGHADTEAQLREQADELRGRLTSNAYFNSLPNKRQAELLRGGKAYLRSLEAIAEDAGIDTRTFKMMWQLMSWQVHGLPASFYRMQGGERGSGVQTVVEENYSTVLLSLSLSLLVGARDEYRALMEPVTSTVPSVDV